MSRRGTRSRSLYGQRNDGSRRPVSYTHLDVYKRQFIHEGTADPRTSKKGKLLVFDDAQGKKVFVRSVEGIRPTPYLEQAYTENSERTVAIFGDELAAAVEKFVNKNFKPVSK